MPFAPRIRKEMLYALDRFIIPALEAQATALVIAMPSFNFSDVSHQVLQKEFLPDKPFAPLQIDESWHNEMVMATHAPTFVFAYEGTCYERVGITQNTALSLAPAQRAAANGLTVLQLEAPTLLCYPAYTLRSLGVPRPENAQADGRALGWKLLKNKLLIYLNRRGPIEEVSTHPLEIEGELVVQVNELAVQLMQSPQQNHIAQQQYLVLMQLFRDYLLHQKPNIPNSSWVRPENYLPVNTASLSLKNQELCYQVIEYIITNLHTPLSLQGIAARFGVSRPFLNTLFHSSHQTTLMRYVTRMRIEAAKKILAETPERINDIASLVGFTNASSFSAAFHRQTGQTPGEYRHSQKYLER
jgi:AraC-like DNA-binding protein